MTNRYYYTDPLAAAWMNEHHGMKLCDNRGFQVDLDHGELKHTHVVVFQVKDPAIEWQDYQEKIYYIHPESLHLLEPQEGDWVQGVYIGKFHAIHYGQSPEKKGWFYYVGDDLKACLAYEGRIIQRNGIAFMWPEKE